MSVPTGRSQTSIDFIIIGAQKCGTTSLFEYLRHHPDVYMPPQKEIGFFSSDRNYTRGWHWYAAATLEDAPSQAVCGEASVGYMSGAPDSRVTGDGSEVTPGGRSMCSREEIIPHRIREHLPGVRMICILRDPVARCLSHYRMAVLAGTEPRSFEQAITDMLRPEALEQARSSIEGSNGYIVRGEYFRILSGFWRTFPRDQLLVIFATDLESRPADVLGRVCEFIGVDREFTPANLGTRYRQAATARRVTKLDLYAWQQRLSRGTSTRAVWHAIPLRARKRLSCWYDRASFRVDLWNARRGEVHDAMTEDLHDTLASHFAADSEALASSLGVEVPWLTERSAGSRSGAFREQAEAL